MCKDAGKRRTKNTFSAPANGVIYQIFKTRFGNLVVIAPTVSGILFSRDAESAYLRAKRTRTFHAPRSCVDVQTMAFACADGLRSLVLDPVRRSAKSVSYRKFRLRDEAFAYCGDLRRVSLPEGLQSVTAKCFHGSGIVELTIPKSVSVIRENAFSMCRSLRTLCLPRESHLETIEESAFLYSGLENVQLNEGLQKVESSCFRGCSIRDITLPSTVTDLGLNAFDNDTNIFVASDS